MTKDQLIMKLKNPDNPNYNPDLDVIREALLLLLGDKPKIVTQKKKK